MFQHVDGERWAAIAVETGGAVGNAGFVDLGGRALVIDACYTPAAARDLRVAAEEPVSRADRLFLTHVHFDHYGGSHVFTDLPIVSASSAAPRASSRVRYRGSPTPTSRTAGAHA
jgi:glyoxylase-like metal-dependent hydrolase (beta-lactamase superfamily II)